MTTLTLLDAEIARLDAEAERIRARRERVLVARAELVRVTTGIAPESTAPDADPHLAAKREQYRDAQRRKATAALVRVKDELEGLAGG